MKDFMKYTLATITGILIVTVIMGIIGVISVLGMIASESAATQVKDNSVFVLKLSGIVEERVDKGGNPLFSLIVGNNEETTGLDDILDAIKKAKENEKIKGIYIEAGLVEFDSYATVQTIRDALADFKKSGKWIIAYSDQYLQMAYYLSSVADKVYLNHTGMIDFKGLGRKAHYPKGLFDKLGITFQVARVGKYKSYVEQNTRTDMSPEDREQRMAYMQGAWNIILKDIATSRKLTPETLNQYANDSVMFFANPKDYVKMKLVDRLMYPEEIKKEIKGKLSIKEDEDINQLSLNNMNNLPDSKKKTGEKIAVYYACGDITDQDLSNFTGNSGIVGKTVAADLLQLAEDDNVKAVVLRVNSGGGSAAASEQIWHALKQLKAKKPVVVSMGGAAASGGYMISCGADYIIAEPTTITGSIGIFGLIPNYSGLVTEKLGVTFDEVTTNKYTNYLENLVLSNKNSDEMRYLQGHVDRGYTNFLNIVAEGRHMTTEQVNAIAQGRVWLATDAQKHKLVDKLGSLDDAVAKAAELSKLKEYHTTSYPSKGSWMDMFMPKEKNGSYLDAQLRSILGNYYDEWIFIRTIDKRNVLQARLPFSIRTK
jgi:protease-4